MIDGYHRTIDYLRISITDRCNLRCRYCMPVDLPFRSHDEILRYEEIERVCRAAVRAGIRHVRVTGGEPLVRKGCLDFLERLKQMPGIETVAITTNGVLLEEAAPRLAAMGIDSVNISLDTLREDTFQKIAQRDLFREVWKGLMTAIEAGLRVKVNCVPQRGVNDGELEAMARLAEQYPIDVRFIEMMPMGYGDETPTIGSEEMEDRFRAAYPGLQVCGERRGFGPAHYYEAPGFQGKIGIIDAVSHCFCQECNRIRLSSEGFLKLCLYYDQGVDLRALLRSGAADEELFQVIKQAVAQKPARHGFDSGRREESRTMSQIGG